MIEQKECTQCGESKPISQFSLQAGNTDGRRAICKVCVKTYTGSYNSKKKKEKEWFEQFSPI